MQRGGTDTLQQRHLKGGQPNRGCASCLQSGLSGGGFVLNGFSLNAFGAEEGEAFFSSHNSSFADWSDDSADAGATRRARWLKRKG